MLCFLRLASQDAFCGEVDEKRREKARASFTLRKEKGEVGLSVYRASSEEEEHLIVAAIACRRFEDRPNDHEVQHVDLLPIGAKVLAAFGEAVPTPGDTPIPRANKLHHELQWTQEQLWQLAEHIFGSRLKVRRFKRAEVKASLAALDLAEVDDRKPDVRAWVEQFR